MNKDVLANYRLVNESEASELLSMAKKTLQGWRYQRTGPPYLKIETPGGRGSVRDSLQDLKKWMTESKVIHEL